MRKSQTKKRYDMMDLLTEALRGRTADEDEEVKSQGGNSIMKSPPGGHHAMVKHCYRGSPKSPQISMLSLSTISL